MIVRVPVFEEIIIPSSDKSMLGQALVRQRVGRQPCYLSLNGLEMAQRQATIDQIEEILQEKSISPRFPYPFFIISDKTVQSSFIPIAKSFDELPQYYQRAIKKLTPKETALLNKVLLLNDKIANLSINKSLKSINDHAESQKKFHDLFKEKSFYERIYQNLLGN